MEYFSKFTSNTLAGSGNQLFFTNEIETEINTGRVFYKIFKGGKYNYSILFSNIIDSTYSDGEKSHKNIVCDEWVIESAQIGICDVCNVREMVEVDSFTPLSFGGHSSKTVMPGEMFSSDPILLDIKDNQFVCIEISFRGKMIPYHEETLLPVFIYKDNKWVYDNHLPFASMIGCDREVKKRIAFFGDSITQGIGTEQNSYTHWNARLADLLGTDYSYWNLGLGFGRADDAASDGAWLFKAKQSDVVLICFGVNDILQGYSQNQIINNLTYTVKKLKEQSIKVIVQTIPPFDYDEGRKNIWLNVNDYIKNELSKICDFVFDVVPILCDEEKGIEFAKYGGHPNAYGCKLWAEGLYRELQGKI
ncbi:MAG: SGNH/GDSL hydrolase family protein [Monoglobales bacterium]